MSFWQAVTSKHEVVRKISRFEMESLTKMGNFGIIHFESVSVQNQSHRKLITSDMNNFGKESLKRMGQFKIITSIISHFEKWVSSKISHFEDLRSQQTLNLKWAFFRSDPFYSWNSPLGQGGLNLRKIWPGAGLCFICRKWYLRFCLKKQNVES